MGQEVTKKVLCGRLIDPSSQKVIEDGCVVVDETEGIIVDAGTRGSVEAPSDVEEPELPSNATIMPGLIDAHIHITGLRSGDYIKEPLITPYATLVARSIRDLEAVLDAGYTTIVDAGGLISLELKQAEKEGEIRSPRIVAAGYTVSQTFGHGDIHFLPVEYVDARTTKLKTPFSALLCDGPSECRKAARHALRAGADFIKVFTTGGVASQLDRPEYPQFTMDELKAIVEEAHRAHKFVHAHAEGAEGIVNALEAGITRIAHAIYIDEDGINLALEKNAVIIPTLTIVKLIIQHGRELGMPDWAIEKAEEVYETHVNNIRKAYKAGVKLATGTDIFFSPPQLKLYGLNSLEIINLINDIGLTPLEALKAATTHAAYIAGLQEKTGKLQKGTLADIIVIKENPLTNPQALTNPQNIVMVYKEGKEVKNTLRTALNT